MENIEVYIMKTDKFGQEYKHIIDNPTKNELGCIKADLGWGMKKGTISLVVPERTTTTYWRVVDTKSVTNC